MINRDVVKAFVMGPGEHPDHVVLTYDDTIEKRLEAGSPAPGVLEHLHPEAVLHIPPSMPYGGDHVGHEGFLRMTEANNAAWRRIAGGLEMTFLDFTDDQVICRVAFTGEARRTGQTVDVRMVEIFTLAGSRITDIENFYWDTAAIVAATGGSSA